MGVNRNEFPFKAVILLTNIAHINTVFVNLTPNRNQILDQKLLQK